MKLKLMGLLFFGMLINNVVVAADKNEPPSKKPRLMFTLSDDDELRRLNTFTGIENSITNISLATQTPGLASMVVSVSPILNSCHTPYQTTQGSKEPPPAPNPKKRKPVAQQAQGNIFQRFFPHYSPFRLFEDNEILHVYGGVHQDPQLAMPGIRLKEIDLSAAGGGQFLVHTAPHASALGRSCIHMALLASGQKDYSLALTDNFQSLDGASQQNLLDQYGVKSELFVVAKKPTSNNNSSQSQTPAAMFEQFGVDKDHLVDHDAVFMHLTQGFFKHSLAIVSLTHPQLHFVHAVVLGVEQGGVILADPFHGWVIKVTFGAFAKYLRGDDATLDPQTILWIKS